LIDGDVIDEQMQNSLLSKIDNASQSADKENICSAAWGWGILTRPRVGDFQVAIGAVNFGKYVQLLVY
jgi:hypothetical protein